MRILWDWFELCLIWASGVLRPSASGLRLPEWPRRTPWHGGSAAMPLRTRRIVASHLTHAPPRRQQPAAA
ncbi:MAG: hypothetical protein QM617_03490 [Comamonas sp.]